MVTAETKESGITHMAFDDQTLEVSLMTVIQGYTQSVLLPQLRALS